jgi:hypothetical protein
VDVQGLLLTTAEIAVAFAGFASLVGVLLRRSDLDLREHVVNPLRVMLDYALIALFTCLVPFLPMIAGASEPTIWRFSSGVWVVAGMAYARLNRVWLRELNRSTTYRSTRMGQIVRFLDFASFLVLAANALGVLWQPSFLPYYAVQLWFIGGAAIGFIAVVSSIWREPEGAP